MAPAEPTPADLAPAVADAPPCGSAETPAGQRVMQADAREMRKQLEQVWQDERPDSYLELIRSRHGSRSVLRPEDNSDIPSNAYQTLVQAQKSLEHVLSLVTHHHNLRSTAVTNPT